MIVPRGLWNNHPMDSARLHRIIAGLESAIGLGAIVAPDKLVALYGIRRR